MELVGGQLDVRGPRDRQRLAVVQGLQRGELVAVLEDEVTEAVDRARRTIEDIEQTAGGWSFAKLTIANAALRAVGA